MSRLLVITTPALATGFHLAGVDAHGVEDVEAAQELITAWLDAGESGLLAIDENLLGAMEAGFLKRLQAAEHLPYLAIPGSGETVTHYSRRSRIAELIRRATGFRITFKGENAEAKESP